MPISVNSNNTIILRSSYTSRYLEAVVGSTAITPGKFVKWVDPFTVELDDDGAVALASGSIMSHIAVENTLAGKTIDDDYQPGEKIMIRLCVPGDVVLAWAVNPLQPIPARAGYPVEHKALGFIDTQPDISTWPSFAQVAESTTILQSPTRIKVEII